LQPLQVIEYNFNIITYVLFKKEEKSDRK